MATSGNTSVAVASYITLKFSWTAGTQNVANNYTPVSWKLQLISSNSSANINSSAKKDCSVTINGTKVFSGTNTVGLSGGATKTLASGTQNIYHNADGTKTFSYSFSQEFAITYSGSSIGTKTGSGDGTLNTIPRTSGLGTISNFTIGNAIAIPITQYSSGFVNNLVIKFGSTTVKTVNDIHNGDTVTFTAAEQTNIYSLMPSVTKGTFTFTLTTKNGSTTVGTSSRTATGTINANVKPAISSFSLAEYISKIATQFGGYVQNQSQIRGTITATAGSGSSISSYKTVINGQTFTSSTFTTNVLKTAGSNTATVTVTDKRGRTATSTATFNVIAYTPPKITTFTVVRCLADGTEDMVSGEYAKINVVSTISAVSNKNAKNFKLEYKKSNDTAWTTLLTYTAGYSYTLTNSIQAGFSADYPYAFKLTVTDYFHSTPITKTISTGFALMDLKANGKGLAVGKVSSEDDTFDVGFKKTFLSNDTFMGGEKRDEGEKNIYFQNTGNGNYSHNAKIYGGNGNSPASIGMYDIANTHSIFRYLCSLEQFEFDPNIKLLQNGKPVVVEHTYTHSHNTGSVLFSNGLLIQHGLVSITPTVANAVTSATIIFPIAYDVRPTPAAIVQTSAPSAIQVSVGQGSANLDRFSIFVERASIQATTVHWFAIGYKGV